MMIIALIVLLLILLIDGLKFMGKKWDYDVPSIEIWQECLRVLKPGGIALIFAGARTQHRMAVNIEDAGFEIRDCIMWLYGQGFPHGLDISKGIDKKMGVKFKSIPANGVDFMNDKNDGYNTTKNQLKRVGKKTKQAQKWDGYNTNLKPAYEPIIVAMKPLDKNFVNNALTWGVAGLNIDECRIKTKDTYRITRGKTKNCYREYTPIETVSHQEGRYPANIILDEHAAKELDKQSGVLKSGTLKPHKQKNRQGNCYGKKSENITGYFEANQGGASRFFYVAKTSPKEKNLGCENLNNEKYTNGNYSQSPVCKDCNKTLNGTNDHSQCSGEVYYKDMPSEKTGNHHPTIKPIKLMEYLCKLTKTPDGGIVLDPFAGSGTTGIACQNTDRDFILIEREKEFIDVINARLKAHKKETLL